MDQLPFVRPMSSRRLTVHNDHMNEANKFITCRIEKSSLSHACTHTHTHTRTHTHAHTHTHTHMHTHTHTHTYTHTYTHTHTHAHLTLLRCASCKSDQQRPQGAYGGPMGCHCSLTLTANNRHAEDGLDI